MEQLLEVIQRLLLLSVDSVVGGMPYWQQKTPGPPFWKTILCPVFQYHQLKVHWRRVMQILCSGFDDRRMIGQDRSSFQIHSSRLGTHCCSTIIPKHWFFLCLAIHWCERHPNKGPHTPPTNSSRVHSSLGCVQAVLTVDEANNVLLAGLLVSSTLMLLLGRDLPGVFPLAPKCLLLLIMINWNWLKYILRPTTNCFWLRRGDITTFSQAKKGGDLTLRPLPTAGFRQQNVNFQRPEKQRGVQCGAMGLLNLAIHEEYFGILFKDVQASNNPKIMLSGRHFTAFWEHKVRYCYSFQKHYTG